MKKILFLLIMILSVVFLASCSVECSPSAEWVSDANGHWHPCSIKGCEVKFQEEEHLFGEWSLSEAASEGSKATKERTCEVCEYVEIVEVGDDEHFHSYSADWSKDEDNHWYECSCGDKSELAPHAWDEGKVIEQATDTKPGKVGYECTVCGKQKVVEVDANGHSHSYRSEWEKDETNHWNECGCGDKSNVAAHEFSAWVIEGEVEKRSCNVCDYEETRGLTDTWDGSTVSASLFGAGTETDPYLINCAADLAYFKDNAASMAGKYVKLMRDVDMNESNFMIATFAGTFDGNNHTVSGLKLESGSFEVPTGLFCDLEASGTIKNLIVRGSATTEWATAGVVGRSAGIIDNCKNYVTIVSKWDVGGVVAVATAGSITNCENYAFVSGKTNVAGIVGWAKDNVTVSNGKNHGNIFVEDSAGAGVVGCVANNVTVSYCENYGEITGREGLAGIVGGRGNICNVNVTIEHCVNEGAVIGSGNMAGGIAAVFTWNCKNIKIDSCTNKGAVTSNDWNAGGILGQMHSASAEDNLVVSNCVNEGAVHAANGDSGGIVGCLYGYAAADSCTNKGVVTAGAGNANGICPFDENEPSTSNCQDLSAAQ